MKQPRLRRLGGAVFAAVVVAAAAGCGSNVSREDIREAAGLGPTGATAAAASSSGGATSVDTSVGATPAGSSTGEAPAAGVAIRSERARVRSRWGDRAGQRGAGQRGPHDQAGLGRGRAEVDGRSRRRSPVGRRQSWCDAGWGRRPRLSRPRAGRWSSVPSAHGPASWVRTWSVA